MENRNRIKKFFESSSVEDIVSRVKDFFQDMIDNDHAYLSEKNGVISISCSLYVPDEGNIDEFFNYFEENIKVIDEFKSAYDKFKEEFPNLITTFKNYKSELIIYISIGFKEGSFYQIRGNEVIIDRNKFKKVVGGNYNINMSRTYSSFDGSYPSGHIDSDIRYRGNYPEIQRIYDVINNLEIEGEKLVVGKANYYSNPSGKTDRIGLSFRANSKFTYINM